MIGLQQLLKKQHNNVRYHKLIKYIYLFTALNIILLAPD